jgi:hypothetical protein
MHNILPDMPAHHMERVQYYTYIPKVPVLQIVENCEFLCFAFFHVLMLQSTMNKQEIV